MPTSVDYTNDFYKLDSLVREWMADNELSEHWYQKMLSYAMKGLRKVALHSWQEPYSVLLVVDDKYTCTLPENYVKWTKIGLKLGQYIKVLALNGELNKLQRSAEDIAVDSLPLYQMPNGIDFGNYSGYNFVNINGTGESQAGFGSGFSQMPSKGHFNIVKRDDTTNEITFDYDVRIGSEIIVEYISDGFNPNGETVVNQMLADYVHAYLDFKYEEKHNPLRNERSITRMGRNLNDEIRLVRAARNDLDPKTMITITRRETRFTPKM